MKILVVGYAYIKKNYFDTFKSHPDNCKLFFLLPHCWRAKGGKLIFYPPKKENVLKTNFLFYHSNYPLVGGLLKGWAPLLPIFLLKRKYDLVYSSSEPILLTTLFNAIWAKLLRSKHIFFTWENVPYRLKLKGLKGLVQRSILKLNLLLCDAVICGNNKGAAIFKNLTDKPVEVIPLSGVDSEYFTRKSGEKIFKGVNLAGKVVFSFAGAIGYRKGIHLILEAMARIIKEIPDSYLIIAGSGEYEKEVRNLATSLNLEPFISFVPWLDRNGLYDLFSVTDVFVYPSLSYGGWEEQFGYSMAEASLMEIPVISTQTGSVPDIVIDGATGLLVDPNAKGLAGAMLKLGKDKELREKLGRAGRNFVKERFEYSVVANKFYTFFQKA